METPIIALPPKTLLVKTGEIPALIATALHPKPIDQRVKIVCLYTNPKNRTANKISPLHDNSISNYKWKILKKIFKNLPPLKFPLKEPQWQPYETAFRKRGKDLRWELIPKYASPQVAANVKRRAAEEAHLCLLKQAITSGLLKQLHPDLSIATQRYLENGRVLISDFTAYAARLAISVHFSDSANEFNTEDNPQTSAPNMMSHSSNGVPRKKILDSDWPLAKKFTQNSLGRAMSDINNHKWLTPARTTPATRGKGSALWNPATLAECLLTKGHATKTGLTRLIRSDFPDWLDEWNAQRADDL